MALPFPSRRNQNVASITSAASAAAMNGAGGQAFSSQTPVTGPSAQGVALKIMFIDCARPRSLRAT